MADEVSDGQVASPLEAEAVASRLVYERPALRHLGSVNRVTLAQTHRSFSDGIKTKPVRGGG